jgi:hypothetical protein
MKTYMKQVLHMACGLVLCISLSSCSGLKSKHYPGKPLVISEEELSNESIWLYQGDTYYVRRMETNSYIAATLKWDEKKNEYIASSHRLIPSELGEHAFLNIEDGDLYTIFRAVFVDEESMVLFGVDRDKVVQDIADGIVCAHTNKHDVILDGSKKDVDEYIQNHAHSIFSMDSASIAKLIVKKEDSPVASDE